MEKKNYLTTSIAFAVFDPFLDWFGNAWGYAMRFESVTQQECRKFTTDINDLEI